MSNSVTNRILLVDDEADILEMVKYNLEKEGYEVYTAGNGREAIEAAKKYKPELILLDVMMPEMDGVEACMSLREMDDFKNTIIAFLTARGEDYSQIAGFESGADDYITKPIKPRVLVSRVKALLRRGSVAETATPQQVAGISIDRERYIVYKDGEELSLPKKEFELLALLLSKPGKVFTRESIMNDVWGNEIVVGDRTIDVHIRKLREKLGEDLIKTVKGVGYKLDN
ncbi:MAG: response regulator transcription factor [Flavobacteriales bacterium]|nr:response regulator transcription factor [Flavobacteriales bacterium]